MSRDKMFDDVHGKGESKASDPKAAIKPAVISGTHRALARSEKAARARAGNDRPMLTF
jgi:hypothetical protein